MYYNTKLWNNDVICKGFIELETKGTAATVHDYTKLLAAEKLGIL